MQYYLPQNVSVANGFLQLTAHKETYNSYAYTSGWVDTKQKVSYKYGRIVSRMKLPAGKGYWPAFWLAPRDEVYGSWPHSGEIDIMEYLGHETNKAYGTFHTVDNTRNHVFKSVSYTLPSGNLSNAYHDFELQWTPTELRWYAVLYTFWFDEVTFGKVGAAGARIPATEGQMPAFTVAPNPVADQFVLQHQPVQETDKTYTLTITDMQGKTQRAMLLINPAAN
ncbi:hypothetical protein GCM10023187_28930 [Nibrella viscosa]|uniref:GH16 domain-containing protein n=1 Tax=Nibrella viscosa TaxID=1084524 RepID=A0ABP8KJ41_9BACT